MSGFVRHQLNHRLQTYDSPVPAPQAWAVDAFHSHGPTGQVIPCPMKDIPEVLSKVDREMATIFLVAPAIGNWFLTLIDLLVDRPLKLPEWKHLLCQPKSDRFHKNIYNIRPQAWKV